MASGVVLCCAVVCRAVQWCAVVSKPSLITFQALQNRRDLQTYGETQGPPRSMEGKYTRRSGNSKQAAAAHEES